MNICFELYEIDQTRRQRAMRVDYALDLSQAMEIGPKSSCRFGTMSADRTIVCFLICL